jgi:hypothetical protein
MSHMEATKDMKETIPVSSWMHFLLITQAQTRTRSASERFSGQVTRWSSDASVSRGTQFLR